VWVLVVLREQGRFLRRVRQRQVHDVDGEQVGLAGVEAALEDLQVGDGGGVHTQGLRGQPRQGFGRVGRRLAVGVGFGGRVGGAAVFGRHLGQGQFEFGNADHGGGLCLSSSGGVIVAVPPARLRWTIYPGRIISSG
jgi:hypothetical protein